MANRKRDDKVNGVRVHVGGNLYKVPYKRKNGLCGNRYFFKTNCIICGSTCFQDRANASKGNKPTCSRACVVVSRSKPEGSIKYSLGGNQGYVLVKQSAHPRSSPTGWVPQHRLVVEDHIGRYLDPAEPVHHIDMDKQNNKKGNLFLSKTRKEHARLHIDLDRCVHELIKKGYLGFDKKKGTYYVI